MKISQILGKEKLKEQIKLYFTDNAEATVTNVCDLFSKTAHRFYKPIF